MNLRRKNTHCVNETNRTPPGPEGDKNEKRHLRAWWRHQAGTWECLGPRTPIGAPNVGFPASGLLRVTLDSCVIQGTAGKTQTALRLSKRGIWLHSFLRLVTWKGQLETGIQVPVIFWGCALREKLVRERAKQDREGQRAKGSGSSQAQPCLAHRRRTLGHQPHHKTGTSLTQGSQRFTTRIRRRWLQLLRYVESQGRRPVLSPQQSKLMATGKGCTRPVRGPGQKPDYLLQQLLGKQNPWEAMRPPRAGQEQEEATVPGPGETTRGGGDTRAHKPGHPVGSRHGRHWPEATGTTEEGPPGRNWKYGRDAARMPWKSEKRQENTTAIFPSPDPNLASPWMNLPRATQTRAGEGWELYLTARREPPGAPLRETEGSHP